MWGGRGRLTLCDLTNPIQKLLISYGVRQKVSYCKNYTTQLSACNSSNNLLTWQSQNKQSRKVSVPILTQCIVNLSKEGQHLWLMQSGLDQWISNEQTSQLQSRSVHMLFLDEQGLGIYCDVLLFEKLTRSVQDHIFKYAYFN